MKNIPISEFQKELEKRLADFLHSSTNMASGRCYELAKKMAKIGAKLYEMAEM